MYIILWSFETGLKETFGLIARPLPCGPDRHRTLTYFFRKNKWKKTHVCWATLLFLKLCRPTNFPKFQPWVFYPIFYKFNPRFGIFLGGRNETHVYRFLCVKSTHLGGTSPYYSLHMWSYSPIPQPPPLHPLKGHPNNFAILSIYGMHRYENFAQTMGKCWKGAPLWKSNISWNAWVKGHSRVPPQPGCPRVCLPWAHRSYATDYWAYSDFM